MFFLPQRAPVSLQPAPCCDGNYLLFSFEGVEAGAFDGVAGVAGVALEVVVEEDFEAGVAGVAGVAPCLAMTRSEIFS